MTPRPPRVLALPWLLPPAVFLFVLPFAHTIALRWLAALISLGIALWQWRRNGPMPPLPCKAAIAFWVASLLLSVVWSEHPAASLSELKVDVLYSLLMYGSFFALTQGDRELRVWLLTLALGSAVASLVALMWFFQAGPWLTGVLSVTTAGGFATLMITVLPPVALLTVRPWSQRAAWVGYAIPLVAVAGALSLSRMFVVAMMLMMLSAAALELSRGKYDWRRVAMIAAGMTIALVVAGAATLIVEKERGLTLISDLRPAIWKLALQRIAEHPWTGTGYGRLLDSGVYAQAFPGSGSPIWHPHNLVLGFAEEAGVIGALAVVLVFAALGREYWRLYRSDSRAVSLIGTAGLAMLVGVLAKNMTDMFFVRESALMFWSMNGLLLGYGRRAADGSHV